MVVESSDEEVAAIPTNTDDPLDTFSDGNDRILFFLVWFLTLAEAVLTVRRKPDKKNRNGQDQNQTPSGIFRLLCRVTLNGSSVGNCVFTGLVEGLEMFFGMDLGQCIVNLVGVCLKRPFAKRVPDFLRAAAGRNTKKAKTLWIAAIGLHNSVQPPMDLVEAGFNTSNNLVCLVGDKTDTSVDLQ